VLPRRRVLPRALVLAVAALTLAACAPTVAVTVAPHAADPACAAVVLATPDSLGEGLDRLDTNAQATTAWGDPQHPVVLRCGVEPLGPTTDHCVTVQTPDGPSTDWVAVADDPDHESSSDWTFTTYGRVPAVQLTIPAAVRSERSTSYLDVLGPAMQKATKERACL